MSDGCINARADCPCSPGEVHYHTRNGIHVADEVTTAFFALRKRLAAAARERDEAVAYIEKIKQYVPKHGPCCTCQVCGKHYDDCRCEADELHEEIGKLKERLAAADRERDEAREELEQERLQHETSRQKIEELLDRGVEDRRAVAAAERDAAAAREEARRMGEVLMEAKELLTQIRQVTVSTNGLDFWARRDAWLAKWPEVEP